MFYRAAVFQALRFKAFSVTERQSCLEILEPNKELNFILLKENVSPAISIYYSTYHRITWYIIISYIFLFFIS